MKTLFASVLVALACGGVSLADAQSTPPPLPVSQNPYPMASVMTVPVDGVPIGGASALATEMEMPRHYGVVASVSQWHVQFTDARSVDLHPYTVIEPRGGTIRKGQRILVLGYYQYTSKPNAPVIDARSVVIVNGDGRDR